ncbi:Hypothetical protein PAS_chr4_0451 [Komagataella phaffii GS115]|uniref:Beta-mannosyltransferase 1 n=2 Tax=Komagataella phaffii TaxID=460519 RepID=BMT1_KOMPG|nr:Hypothetical protein PAS_chr4_0451 [Komagataella phaffii GS115]C4R7X9.1 RecName: Full=Beta-mannosyltransferase 1 [Komagataella phaffii GS115]F2QZ65.2 RecName: Full=Beta-mannosyltransferase 1 [Komagataella phaffii CBS 7435]AOA64644.1 GQ67_04810T0 [Komagataella phaffii]AOA69555.1 GQ68_04782T0 [Komagataella phaffii GS115]CAY71704.1 Hypothetical protein PAS_chr4_0451 [Komagataella phaffii GS115]
MVDLFQWLKFYSMRRLGQVAITLVLLNLFVFLGYKFTPSTVIGSPSWEPAVVPTVFNESYLDSLQFTDINVDSFLSDTNGRISVTCDSLAYKGLVKTSKKKELDCDMAYIRRKIFSSEEYGVLADLEAQDITEEQRIKKHWFTFYGSSVYLPEHEVHYLVRRVLFSKVGRADTPVISLLVAQLYDKDWNELTPHTLEIVNPATGNVTPQTFPQLIHVPIEWSVDDKWKGTEDPRVFLKPSKTGVSEPIVLFNLQSSLCDGKRGMFVTSPFRSDKVNLLDIEDKERPNSEKNWSPFFLDDVEVSKYSTGYVHFVYSFNPLKVIKCSLDTGACRMIYESPEEGRFGSELRGATPMVKLPVHLSLPKGKEVWVAFPRTRLRDCGCSRTTYRPVLTLFVKEGNKFYTELISSSIDFHIDVLSYDAKGESCSGSISVLIPNGIDSWDVSKKQGGKSDILTLTLSEADRNTVVVHVKGLLDYLLVLNGEGPIHDSHSFKNVLSTNHFKSDTTLLNSVKAAECAIFSSRDYCKKYGETRGEPARYAKQMENERKEKEKKEKEAKEKLEAEKAEMEEAVRKAQEAIAQKEREKEEAEQEKKAQQEAKEKEAEEKAAKEKEAKENEAKKKIIVEKLAKEQEEAEKLEAKKKLYQLQEEERS